MNSKCKGSSFERWVSKELSLWISKGERQDLFWRTHSSGSLGTISKMRTEYGDIMAIHEDGKTFMQEWNIECRHGKVLNVKDLLYAGVKKKKSSSIIQFIEEGRTNARLSRRKPLWIFKEQGGSVLCMMDKKENYHESTLGPLATFNFLMVCVFDFKIWKYWYEEKMTDRKWEIEHS